MIELDPPKDGKQRVWKNGRFIGELVERDGLFEWLRKNFEILETEWFKTREDAVNWIDENE